MKRVFRWNEEHKRLEEVLASPRKAGITIIEDRFAKNPAVSPVDGTFVDSRRKAEEHNVRNGTVYYQDLQGMKQPD